MPTDRALPTDHRCRCVGLLLGRFWVGPRPSSGRPSMGGRTSEWVGGPAYCSGHYLSRVAVPPLPACLPALRALAGWQWQAVRSVFASEGRGMTVYQRPPLFLPSFPLTFQRRARDDGMVGRSLGPSDTMHAKPSHSLSLSLSPPRGLDFATRDPLFLFPPLLCPLPLPLLVQRFALRPQSRFSPWFRGRPTNHVRSQDYPRNQPLLSSCAGRIERLMLCGISVNYFYTDIQPAKVCQVDFLRNVQGSAKRSADFVKQQPGRARQKS